MRRKSNHDKVLTALLSTKTIAEAAKRAKLSEPTVYRYLNDRNFKQRYRAARRELVESSISQIQAATEQAVETLKRNLTCDAPSTEVRAAQIIIDAAIRGIENLDILERLERLEDEHQKKN